MEQEVNRLAGDTVKIVDLYTLLWLVREFETNTAARPESPFARGTEVVARPDQARGLAALPVGDGPFTVVAERGVSCWRVPRHQPPRYLYFDVDDGFQVASGGELEMELEYLDTGSGRVVLEYDSTDGGAPHGGAYKPHPQVIRRAGTGEWRKAVFRLGDARFSGRQNAEADFRFFNSGDDLLVRAVTVRRIAGKKPSGPAAGLHTAPTLSP